MVDTQSIVSIIDASVTVVLDVSKLCLRGEVNLHQCIRK